MRKRLQTLFVSNQPVTDWKKGNWLQLLKWFGDFNLDYIIKSGKKLPYLLQLEVEDKRQ